MSKLTTEEYVRDPRFEAHGFAIKVASNEPAFWVAREQLENYLALRNFTNTAIIAHHAQFDGLILAHHYGIRPAFWFDTLSMARQVIGTHLPASLGALAKHFKLPDKSVPYEKFKGKRWRDIDPATREEIARGACLDVDLTWQIFAKLMREFPREELPIVDMTVRMFTEPVLRADLDLLGKVWSDEERRKNDGVASLGIRESDVQSATTFADLLRSEGVDIEYKDGKNGPIPCFAKTDDFMRELLEHENPRIRSLVACRLDIRSTINQTRAERLGFMATRGTCPVYLRYAGAHTTRWSGGDNLNWQNFPRGSDIRKAIRAPEGHLIVTVDLSQIECRILNVFAGQEDVVERFRNGHDPYTGIASEFYGRPITKNDPSERGTGKQAELSCGYGCGPPRFKQVAKLGIYGPPVSLSDEQAARAVDIYRRTHGNVVNLWKTADYYIGQMDRMSSWKWGPLLIENRRIYLPNGGWLNYETLEWYRDDETGDAYWRVRVRNGWRKFYGAKLVENVVQAMARVVMSQAMARIASASFRIVNTEHDKVAVVIKQDGHEQEAFECIQAEMKRVPWWMPELPLDAEGHMGERYE